MRTFPVLVYRIQKKAFVSTILTGEGARLYGGRWNPVGTPLIYTSTTPELAVLETLLHLDGTPLADQPPLVLVTIEIRGGVEEVAEPDLPPNWNHLVYPEETPRFLLAKLTPAYPVGAFSVPSAVLSRSPSRNVLINPVHPQIGSVRVVEVVPYQHDERLLGQHSN